MNVREEFIDIKIGGHVRIVVKDYVEGTTQKQVQDAQDTASEVIAEYDVEY